MSTPDQLFERTATTMTKTRYRLSAIFAAFIPLAAAVTFTLATAPKARAGEVTLPPPLPPSWEVGAAWANILGFARVSTHDIKATFLTFPTAATSSGVARIKGGCRATATAPGAATVGHSIAQMLDVSWRVDGSGAVVVNSPPATSVGTPDSDMVNVLTNLQIEASGTNIVVTMTPLADVSADCRITFDAMVF